MGFSENGGNGYEDPLELAAPFPSQSRGWRMAAITASVALVVICLLLAASAFGADAMNTCQQQHSFDTCFNALEG